MYGRRAQADGDAIAGLFQGILVATGALLVGTLIGGYYIGAAIGIVGSGAAVAAGFGIILGGVAILTAIGLGIYGIVNCCLRCETSRFQQAARLQQQATNRVEASAESTKQIMRRTSASKLIDSAALDANKSETNPEDPSQTISRSASVKQSSFSKLLAIFKRNSQPTLPSTDVRSEPCSPKL
jgi:predicted lipid-binding transport protein (Tim44 family)